MGLCLLCFIQSEARRGSEDAQQSPDGTVGAPFVPSTGEREERSPTTQRREAETQTPPRVPRLSPSQRRRPIDFSPPQKLDRQPTVASAASSGPFESNLPRHPFDNSSRKTAEVIDLTRDDSKFHHFVLTLDVRHLYISDLPGNEVRCHVR